MNGLKDLRLRVNYRADIGMLFLNGEMISDNFCNGDTWGIGLREHAGALRHQPLVLKLTPLKKGASVNVASAMAARNEQVESTLGAVDSVSVQGVAEIEVASGE